MASVRRSTSLITRITASVALIVGLGVMANPAAAHEAPAKGSTCEMSGMTEIVHGKVYVCRNTVAGSKPRWGAGLPISAAKLTMSDGWAKAAKKGMSAAFGMVMNPTAKPIRIIGAFSDASEVLQLHEVVDKDGSMVMQQKNGGFVIPAGGMLTLKPGGNHVMFMDLTKAIKAGDMVPVTLITSDGGLFKTKVLGKVYNGGNETYMPGM
jgi:periplasmic copper chaperone A